MKAQATCPSPATRPVWALRIPALHAPTEPLREVLVLGAPRPSLQQLTRLLQREGYIPSVAHTGAEALQRIVREPIPPVLLVHWGEPADETLRFLQTLRYAGALGWFSLLLIGGGELPAGLHAQERLASDCSTARLLEVLSTYTA